MLGDESLLVVVSVELVFVCVVELVLVVEVDEALVTAALVSPVVSALTTISCFRDVPTPIVTKALAAISICLLLLDNLNFLFSIMLPQSIYFLINVY